jgi:hypothetical protein
MDPGSTPEWAGWLALGSLVAVFAALAWWLFFSPLPPGEPEPVRTDSPRQRRVRALIATLMLVSGTSFLVGARWDEFWHRLYGGFGEDFLWPPHLMMYASLGLNAVFAVVGLGIALRGRGGVRARFRQEPLLGFLGLTAAYQMAAIPSDLLWHEIIGPDITAWSLPHVLLALTTSMVLLAGVALALSASSSSRQGNTTWRLLHQAGRLEWVALALIGLSLLALLQLGTTEWEWTRRGTLNPAVLQRPMWMYPVVVLAVGIAHACLALFATRLAGAASLVAAVVLLIQMAAVAAGRFFVPPGPILAAHLLLLAPALVLDAWFAWRTRLAPAPAGQEPVSAFRDPRLWSGIAIYTGVYFAVALPYIAAVMAVPALSPADSLASVAIGLAVACVVGPAGAALGAWLGHVGASPVSSPAPSARMVVNRGERQVVSSR